MKGIILLNGEPYQGEFPQEKCLVFCCDGAYEWAKGRILIDENIGDFDSLLEAPYPPPSEIYPSEKDFSDGEIALKKMLERGVEEILIYGGGGKREDHFFGNLHLLYAALKAGVRAKLVTNYSEIFLANGACRLKSVRGKTISIFPFFGEAVVENSKGLHYAFSSLTLTAGNTLGLSNFAKEDEVYFFVKEGICIVFVDAKKKGEEGG